MSYFDSPQPRWFSENPDRAWAEKLFLAYIPIWISILLLFETFFDTGALGDVPVLLLGLVVALPLFVVPAMIGARKELRPWHDSYWFKAFLYIFIVSFSGNYFISEYFFDVLGMVYNYPNLNINLDSALVGSGEHKVPLLMFLLTQATYTTYHTTAIVVMRRVMTTKLPMKWLVFAILSAALAYAWAWTETMSFANAELESNFSYKDKETMLAYGSIVFGMAFVFSFPIFYFLDENPRKRWSLFVVVGAAMTAAWLGLFLTDVCTHVIR